MQRDLRYTTLVSDGDAKTFSELTKIKPYGDVEIVKGECTNHEAKRLGTGLRNLVTSEAKKGITLGGRRAGALTQQKMGMLQNYYKKAVSSKCSTVEELRKSIIRTFNHASSTDDHPQHEDCPTGKKSWWFFQRALAYGKAPPPHIGKCSCHLSPPVAKAVWSVYEHLTSDALLSRCMRGMTQNANESFHSQVWMHCPKHLFACRRRLEIALSIATTNSNNGSVGFHRLLSQIGCSLNGTIIERGEKRDCKWVRQAEPRQSKEVKRRQLEINFAKARAQQEYERREGGPSYASGAF